MKYLQFKINEKRATKPYLPIEETFEAFMNADFSDLGDGFRPFTMAELNRWLNSIDGWTKWKPRMKKMRPLTKK